MPYTSNVYTDDWRIVRKRVLEAANYTCEGYSPKCIGRASQVDHIDRDTQNNDDSNLRAVCEPCHQAITLQNREDSRNHPAPNVLEHPAILVKKEEKVIEIVDDEPSADESEWFTAFGPVWDRLENGEYVKPEFSLGYYVINWVIKNLQLSTREKGIIPFIPTAEQARLIMWMYAIDKKGNWIYEKTLQIASKGKGKDPFAAMLLCVEMCGPCRFDHWNENGQPVPRRENAAICQIAAVSFAQNENTLIYLKEIFNEQARQKYEIEVLENTIYAFGRRSRIEAKTSSSESLEGGYPTFIVYSETQHWTERNGCYRMFRTLDRNLGKVANSHSFMTTNAYDPNEGSVAQDQFEAWEAAQKGEAKDSPLLLDFRGATPKAPYKDFDDRIKVLKKVYGSSKWAPIEKIARKFDDASEDIQQLIRFYYNTVGIQSLAAFDVREWDRCKATNLPEKRYLYTSRGGVHFEHWLPFGSQIILAADLSKNEDSTGLVAIIVGGPWNGVITPMGVWEKPRRDTFGEGEVWKAPIQEVDERVRYIREHYKILAFFADPSHKMNDEGGGSYWMPTINSWHQDFGKKLIQFPMWAVPNKHSIMFDMALTANTRAFTDALGSFAQELTDNTLRHDGDSDLRRHLQNARRFQSKSAGLTISKESPKSTKKIDLIVTAVIAYMLFTRYFGDRRTRTPSIQKGN